MMNKKRFSAISRILSGPMPALKLGALLGSALVVLNGCGSSPEPTGRYGHYKVGQPYQIAGIWYHPKEDWSYDQTGTASWYGDQFHGRKTANGEIFDMHALSAAHPTLPMPTRVKVTNLENGRSLILRVNDRGPFKKNRILDVSKRAAEELGFYRKGSARVRVTMLGRAPLGPVTEAVSEDATEMAGAAVQPSVSPDGTAPIEPVIAKPIPLYHSLSGPVASMEPRPGAPRFLQPGERPASLEEPPASPQPAAPVVAAEAPEPERVAIPQPEEPRRFDSIEGLMASRMVKPKAQEEPATRAIPEDDNPPASTRPANAGALRPLRPIDRNAPRGLIPLGSRPQTTLNEPRQGSREGTPRESRLTQEVARLSPPAAVASAVRSQPVSPYYLQVGTYRVQAYAADVAAKLRSGAREFGSVEIVERPGAMRTFYRVMIGPVSNIATGAALKTRLKELGFAETITVRR